MDSKFIERKMKVVITGTSSGIGRAIAELFLERGHFVHGIDILPASILHLRYLHHKCSVSEVEDLPEIKDVDIVINNAGTQNDGNRYPEGFDMQTNFWGAKYVTETYVTPYTKSVLFIGSVSAHTGDEFAEYVASKGALQSYMKHCAIKYAPWNCTVNSLDPGGVLTDLNRPVMSDENLWREIMNRTPMRRWASPEEIAEWAYFLTVTNRFATGQSIIVDGGERSAYQTFIWPQ